MRYEPSECACINRATCISRNKQQSMGRSRRELTSKMHAVVDNNGLPVRLALAAGEAHDSRLVEDSSLEVRNNTPRGPPYDADWTRALAAERGVWANIPPRCNRNEPIYFSPYLYRARNLVERFFTKIKQCRRVDGRYTQIGRAYCRKTDSKRTRTNGASGRRLQNFGHE